MKATRIAHSIMLAWGWRRALTAFAAGAATTLALPPFNVWPLPFLTFPVLVWLISAPLGSMHNLRSSGWNA